MSYSGTTAATSASNPPRLVDLGGITRTLLGTTELAAWSSGVTRPPGHQVWRYNSTNLTTDIVQAGFFSDGQKLGMQVGDLMLGVQYTSAGSSFVSFMGVLTSTNSTAGYNLSTGGTMTSTFG